MKDGLCEVVCVLDRSDSMATIREDAIGGFNAFLDSQKKHPGEARFTLVLFDHEYDLIHDGADIQNVPPLDGETYVPRGTTALLDAIGRTVDDVGRRLAETPEDERPSKVIVAILTDGLENAIRDYDNRRVSAMIHHQREKYGWEFIFLAANQDAIATARSMSIHPEDTFAYEASPTGIREAHAHMDAVSLRHRRKR
ncbi:MAG: VWA domain-containing protein [Rubrobacter sp.]|nr:VWA domain-containing protein [Rubrobacter sp.]